MDVGHEEALVWVHDLCRRELECDGAEEGGVAYSDEGGGGSGRD